MAENTVRELIHEVSELEAEVVPPAPALPPLIIPEIPVGRVFVFLIGFYALAVATRSLFLEGPSLFVLFKHLGKATPQISPTPSILFDYFLYMCLACQFFPIPTLPPIAFAAKAFSPALVAVVGALGTCIANLNDYAILGWLFRHQKVKKIRDLNTYRKLLNVFDRYAFLTLSVATFLPIPIDVVRMLAISRAYRYWKYICATFVGRLPRYLILAYVGRELPAKYILILFAVFTTPAVIKFFSDIIRKRRKG